MTKNHDNRRRQNAEKIAKEVTRAPDSKSDLVKQYKIIREDVLKLREDLSKGYDLAKQSMDKKTLLNELMKFRQTD